MTQTKMLFTIGPATDKPGILSSLIATGMNCARLNFSHGDHDSHAKRFKQLQLESKKLNKSVATLLDLTGPKLRVGKFENEEITLTSGQVITLTVKKILGNADLIPVNYNKLAKEVKLGDTILLDDGLIRLTVLNRTDQEINCKVIIGGQLKNQKGINLPGVKISLPPLTPKDHKDLAFGLSLGVDYVALSFVRSADEIIKLKKLIKHHGYQTPVIAKIEKPEAIPVLEEIIEAADGIMIARGDLGVEMSPEQVPTLQKKMITMANRYGRLVITATQMLQSMMDNPTPTRAEASDVANAIFDGTDAVMLSGETAAGSYPRQAANMMRRIIESAEIAPEYNRLINTVELNTQEDHVVATAVTLAEKVHAKALVVYTRTGNTAKLVSRQRPEVPVIALAHEKHIFLQLALWWGLDCLLTKNRPAIESVVKEAETILLAKQKVKSGDKIVIIASSPRDTMVNLIKLHIVN